MKTAIKAAVLATFCFGVAACDSKGTQEVKDTAKALDESYEAQADLVDAAGTNAPDNAAVEAKADALRNEGEAIKDNLMKEAKQTQKDTAGH